MAQIQEKNLGRYTEEKADNSLLNRTFEQFKFKMS